MFGYTKENWTQINGLNTASEIYQQPELWGEVLEIVKSNIKEIGNYLKERLNKKDIRVILTGAGTSAYVGEIVAAKLNAGQENIYEAIATTDIVDNPGLYLKKDIPTILVSFARSGNSPESVAAYNLANELVSDISHIFITCNSKGKLAEISKDKENILLLTMPEESNDKGFAMTSSFSCMTLTSLLIFDLENLKENEKQVAKLISTGKRILDEDYKGIQSTIDVNYSRVIYLGSSNFRGLTKESSLKLLELTRGQIVSQSETVLGFRHGPKSIVNDDSIIIVYISDNDYTRKYEIDILKEIYHDAGNHKLIAISNNYYEEIEDITDEYLYLAKDNSGITNVGFISLLYAIYAQVFSLLSSVKSEVEPDNPNPSGLVNRVVKGVTIYKY
ncbi:SIS domain-containing protein [Tissierella sp. MB52-C2]|uniref:SIS domain-containing protein n=1 Tax=Tissierella sp. MB52-C2 TaxID=3070999 RepID=UPI00280B85A8|nr:SIS domain-containing protein [Tissierella sp. MB52-C2]WMM23468.1 SIS domain-containing protein [Tissierella sp. MB52-C2]